MNNARCPETATTLITCISIHLPYASGLTHIGDGDLKPVSPCLVLPDLTTQVISFDDLNKDTRCCIRSTEDVTLTIHTLHISSTNRICYRLNLLSCFSVCVESVSAHIKRRRFQSPGRRFIGYHKLRRLRTNGGELTSRLTYFSQKLTLTDNCNK